jgi:radical SAM protein with 4Fe4S-binding SPASM domain
LHTNVIFVNEKKARLFFNFKDKCPWMTFSIDALNQSTYKKIRRGGDVNIVYNNIQNFILLRKKLGFRFPNLNLQFILMEENAEELRDFVDYWLKFYKENNIISNDAIYIKRIEVHNIEKQEKANKIFDDLIKKYNLYTHYNNQLSIRSEDKPKEGVYWFEKKEEKRKACSSPFKNPVIRWDGEMTVCCLDDIFFYSMGNLNEKSFDDIWYGKKMDEFRKKHIEGKFDELLTNTGEQKCKNCIGYFWPKISDQEIEEYKRDKGI